MNTPMSTPAERIAEYIKNKGIKQTFISQKTGIDDSSLSAKLNGKTKLTVDDIELICGAIGCSPSQFLIARAPATRGA
jgi:transcriptional regulator with XRE-family HTH domain